MAAQGDAAPGVLVAHPMGCTSQTAVHRTMLELAAPALRNNEAATHTHTSRRSWKDALEKVILRARPGHQQPREGRAWTWIFANKETAEIKDDLVIEKLMLVRCKKIFFAPLHSQGGPTVKFIRKMAQQTKSRGDDGGVDVQQLYRNWDADDV